MPLPSVLIAANPYEGALCEKALAEIGVRVDGIESLDGALGQLAASPPLVIVIADGWFGGDARELLVEARAGWNALPIFLVADREGDIADEQAAVRRGATRLFFRPIDVEALAAAVETLAVQAERAADGAAPVTVADPITEKSVQVVEGGTLELDAASELEWEEPPRAAGVPLPRVSTEVLPAPGTRREPEPAALAAGGEPERVHEDLLRADEALAEAAGLRLPLLAGAPELRVEVARVAPSIEPREPEAPLRPAPFSDRSTFARRLDRELSEAERRLFPGSAPTARPADDYGGALDDIDLDALAFDTLPGLGPELVEPRANGAEHHAQAIPAIDTREEPSPLLRLAGERSARASERASVDEAGPGGVPAAPTIAEEGSLADTDLAELVGGLYAAGYSGRLSLERGDGQKQIYFEEGCPVFATSSFAHDRLGDQLFREGKLGREQHARTRELHAPPGRRTAARFVELGMLKSRELYPTLRRHVEEIFYSCFSWDSGRYRLEAESAPAEERLRLPQHPWALVLEGVRRKYGLDRLSERLGPPETVLAPTPNLARALEACELAPPERLAAELVDGVRTLAEIEAQAAALRARLGEVALHALLFGLTAIGAARRSSGTERVELPPPSISDGDADPLSERRSRGRDREERAIDRVVDRERLLAKRAQIADADYFAVLGLPRDATAREIDRAFVRLRADFSPERFAEAVRAELGDALIEIGEVLEEAHRVLMDERVRDAYRAHLVD